MPDTTVKYFDSTMSGAPGAIDLDVGSLLEVLDACLVDGFGEVTLDSLSVSSNVATGTLSTGHNFTMVGETGPVILIAGATPSGLNGQWRVNITSGTTFTFATTGISNGTASGTITAKRAPAGWEKSNTGTNANKYRSLDVDSTQLWVNVGDNDTDSPYYASAQIYEGASALANATGYWFKSAVHPGWTLIADHRAFYLAMYSGNNGYGHGFFGDLANPYDADDAYACGVGGHATTTLGTGTDGLPNILNSTDQSGARLAKSADAATAGPSLHRVGHRMNITTTHIGDGGTSAIGGKYLVYPVEAWEAVTNKLRGWMPGWYGAVHANSFSTSIMEHGGLGRTLAPLPLLADNVSYWQWFDVTGPWR